MLDPEKYLKKLVGRTDIEDALGRLDKLTQDEVRMATAQLLKITHGVDDKVTRIDDGVKGVDAKVKCVDNKVNNVCDTVKLVLDGVLSVIFLPDLVINVYTSRWKGNKSSHERSYGDYATYGEQRRRSEAFVVLCLHYSLILKCPHREPVASGPPKVALISRSIHKSHHLLRRSAQGISKVVLPRQSVRRMEDHRLSAVDPWQAYVIQSCPVLR